MSNDDPILNAKIENGMISLNHFSGKIANCLIFGFRMEEDQTLIFECRDLVAEKNVRVRFISMNGDGSLPCNIVVEDAP